ncbi:MAG TPA: acyltransferase [Pseudomonadales bacterium]|nr:acyltransferase [Pseudomonadales bacterium]
MSDHWIKGGRTLPPTPLSGIDLNSGYMPVRRVFYFSGVPDIAKLQASLVIALTQWPDFSATIAMSNEKLCLLRNDTGVRFTVEKRDEAIPAFGIHEPLGLPDIFCDAAIGQTTGDCGPVFTVKIICFSDNHWTLGTCNSHALCDGSGYWQFMQSWRDAFHDQPFTAIASQFMRYGAGNSDISHSAAAVPAHLHIPAVPLFKQQMLNAQSYRSAQMLLPQASLEKIKTCINTTLAPDWVSTQDVVMAMSWQCLARIALAQGAAGDQDFPLANVINIRSQLKLEHYVGNMVYSVSSHATLADICESPLEKLAQKIRRDARHASAQNMRAHLDFMQKELQQGHYNAGGYLTGFSLRIAEACVYGRGVMINNWSRFPAYAMDFSGTPLWFDLATSIPMHFVMAMPSPDGIVLRLFLPATQLIDAMTQLDHVLKKSTEENATWATT